MMTLWTCEIRNRLLCSWKSAGGTAISTPVMPPMTNVTMNPIDHRTGTVNRTRPPYIVNSQLKTLTPVGTAIIMVMTLADGRPVQIGGGAFDVLMVLIDAQGSVVSKNALMERVWRDRIVEENNLQIQISALRAAFGADRDLIQTVAGRGYQFTGEIRIASAGPDSRRGSAAVDHEAPRPPGNVPQPVS